jgi:hypothetical protein
MGKLEIAKKTAEIVSKVIGFPYATRRSIEEGIVWEVYANHRLHKSIMRKKYGRDYYFPTKRMQREIGMNFDLSNSIGRVKYWENGLMQFESTIMVDLAWAIENDDFAIPEKVIPQLDDPKNLPKWKKRMPVTATMLEKCYEAAREVSERSGIMIVATREGHSGTDDEYVFKTSFDANNMTEEKFFKEIERHCRAMVRAYKMYEPWLTGSEYRKLIRARKHIK